MKKMLLFFICTIILTGCFGEEEPEVQSAQAIVKSIDIDQLTDQPKESSFPHPSLNTDEDLESTRETVDEQEVFTPNFDTLKEIMALKKERVIEILGDSFTKYVGNDSQSGEGLVYEHLGLNIIFDKKMGRIETIYCNELVDINGVKLGMEPFEFIELLGNGKTTVTTGLKPSYEILYNFGQFNMRITATDMESPSTLLKIERNYTFDESIAPRASFKSDLKHIQDIFNMDRGSIIEQLGMDYSLYYINADTYYGKGIFYEKYGLMIDFDDSGDQVYSILCDDWVEYEEAAKVDINGARVGMTVSEVREILGEGEFIDRTLDPVSYPPNYLVEYGFGEITVSFGMDDLEGITNELYIYRNTEENLENSDSDQIQTIAYALDFNEMKEIISLTQEQVIAKLGEEYGEYLKYQGIFELGFGLFYERYGMIIVRDYDSNENTIYCRVNVEINGAKLGMTFFEIQQLLGNEGVVEQVKPEYDMAPTYNRLTYTYDDFTISFSAYEKGGKTVEVKIQSARLKS